MERYATFRERLEEKPSVCQKSHDLSLRSFFTSYTSDEIKTLLIVLLLDIYLKAVDNIQHYPLLAQLYTFGVSISARN